MTDREMLELAAKAAGIEHVTPMMVKWGTWNPLADDGDALRLAVALRIGVWWPRPGDHVCAARVATQAAGCCEDDLSDPAAATRRAIVRAAAEIGRAMP